MFLNSEAEASKRMDGCTVRAAASATAAIEGSSSFRGLYLPKEASEVETLLTEMTEARGASEERNPVSGPKLHLLLTYCKLYVFCENFVYVSIQWRYYIRRKIL